MMTTQAVAAELTDARTERYREAERALWDHYGLAPVERWVEIAKPHVRLRVVEVGSGEPAVFIPGTPGTGPYWGALLRELPGVRALLLDRPGWGLSSPVDYSRYRYPAVVGQLVTGVLDAIGLTRAAVVGHSIGNVWALRAAAAEPHRIGRVALFGGGPLVADLKPPPFIKLLASPIGALIVRLPMKAGQTRGMLRQSGHATTLDAGRIPEAFIAWRVAMNRFTDSMSNERAMVRNLLRRDGWDRGLTFDEGELAAIQQPVLWTFGTSDPVGSVETWQGVGDQLPHAELRVVEGAGHLPWLDDPAGVGHALHRFLVP
jgi:2-hydroxy-6-oxonona-2,4-dienedioate hydrolase